MTGTDNSPPAQTARTPMPNAHLSRFSSSNCDCAFAISSSGARTTRPHNSQLEHYNWSHPPTTNSRCLGPRRSTGWAGGRQAGSQPRQSIALLRQHRNKFEVSHRVARRSTKDGPTVARCAKKGVGIFVAFFLSLPSPFGVGGMTCACMDA
ncbi:hypothetical protein BC826DRAFT_674344 [Russula brevipes]|nr:hypothetical protein BC826DRAFT_674344 [Russula brevipes]